MKSYPHPKTTEEFEAYKDTINAIAHSLRRALIDAREIEMDCLVAAGYRGLLHASRRFDPARNVPFFGYAFPRIRGAMIDEVRNHFRDRRALNLLPATSAGVPSAENVFFRHELMETIQRAIDDLDTIESTIVEEHILEESSLAAIAVRFGRSRSWASRRCRAALDKLKRDLNKVLESDQLAIVAETKGYPWV